MVFGAYTNEPMGVADRGTFVALPDSPPQDIPANGFRDYAFDGKPKRSGHTCLRVEIFKHNSVLGELDVSNNKPAASRSGVATRDGAVSAPCVVSRKHATEKDG